MNQFVYAGIFAFVALGLLLIALRIERALLRIVVAWLAVSLATVGMAIAAVMPGDFGGPCFPEFPPATSMPVPLVQAANQSISFEYRFPAGYWTLGQHQLTYLFESCPWAGDLPDHLTFTFQVSEDAKLLTSPVYIQPNALTTGGWPAGLVLGAIHPSQLTIAAASVIRLTPAEVDQAKQSCNLSIVSDGGAPHRLIAGEIYPPDQP